MQRLQLWTTVLQYSSCYDSCCLISAYPYSVFWPLISLASCPSVTSFTGPQSLPYLHLILSVEFSLFLSLSLSLPSSPPPRTPDDHLSLTSYLLPLSLSSQVQLCCYHPSFPLKTLLPISWDNRNKEKTTLLNVTTLLLTCIITAYTLCLPFVTMDSLSTLLIKQLFLLCTSSHPLSSTPLLWPFYPLSPITCPFLLYHSCQGKAKCRYFSLLKQKTIFSWPYFLSVYCPFKAKFFRSVVYNLCPIPFLPCLLNPLWTGICPFQATKSPFVMVTNNLLVHPSSKSCWIWLLHYIPNVITLYHLDCHHPGQSLLDHNPPDHCSGIPQASLPNPHMPLPHTPVFSARCDLLQYK